jgi:RimJ/RimL family protein N-acetyltransferase
LSAIYEKGGSVRLLRFLASRLVFRVWHTVVFEMAPPKQVQVDWPAGEVFCLYNRETPTMPSALANYIREYEAELPDLVSRGDWVYVVLVNGNCAHFGSVCFSSRQLRVLGEPNATPIIGHCFTAPAARGKGLYKRALATIASHLGASGYSRVVVETHPANHASRRGIRGAGFEMLHILKVCIFLNLIAVTHVDQNGKRRLTGRIL